MFQTFQEHHIECGIRLTLPLHRYMYLPPRLAFLGEEADAHKLKFPSST